MTTYSYEHTDNFTAMRGVVAMPELTHYGYDGGTNYVKTNRVFERELVKRVKSALGMTGVRCARESWGDTIVLRPYGMCQMVVIAYQDA